VPAPTTAAAAETTEEEVVKLSPFEVSATSESNSYTAATTLAGNHLNTELRDIGNAVSVVTNQFMKDIGATDNSTLLQYTTNTEVGNVLGNFVGGGNGTTVDESSHFLNPNANTRVRGLTNADNTRDYFLSSVPWEGYNIDGVDLQRGPNSILFGQGSPAGIINTRTKVAGFKDSNEVSFQVGSWGTTRATLDINKVLLKDELAIRLDAVRSDQHYRQDPAFNLDKRIFGALRFEPHWLKLGSARTIITANIEVGNISSNNPRQLPPIDQITPWFQTGSYLGRDSSGAYFAFPNMNRATFTPIQNEDDNTGIAGHGTNRPSHNGPADIGGQPNQYYQPWVGPSLGGEFGNPVWNFNWNNTAQGTGVNWEPQGYHGMASDGTINTRNTTVGATPYQRPAGIAVYSQYASNAKLPFSSAGVYRDKSLTDASVFDFYNHLLDGPNKWEWQGFRTYNLSLAQTFLNDRVGFQAQYNKEWWKGGQYGLLGGQGQSIQIDPNTQMSDGNANNAFLDASANPNFGRPFVAGTGSGNERVDRRESWRIVAFGILDFHDMRRNTLTRFLGKHTVTGMLNSDKLNSEYRQWQRYGVDNAFAYLMNNVPSGDPPRNFNNGYDTPMTFIYLGPSLASKTTASGAHVPAPTVKTTITSGPIRQFVATWLPSTNPADPSYVNPGAYWMNAYYPVRNPVSTDGSGRWTYKDSNGVLQYLPLDPNDHSSIAAGHPRPYDSTQSENPNNYTGFTNVPVTITDAMTSSANRDALTTNAQLQRSYVFSRAFTWQGQFWDGALVGTFGVRKDIAKAWAFQETTNSTDNTGARYTDPYYRLNFTPSIYNIDDTFRGATKNTLNVTSHAWTAVAHLNKLPGFSWLPLQLSLFYNHSTDFQPAAQRVDVYGLPLAAPSGKTKDVGIWIETNDGRYAIKLNKYYTSSVGASSSAFQYGWFIGASQAWAANWTNRFQYNWTQNDSSGAVAVNDPTNSEYNYAPAPGESLADAQAREASVIAAWRAWQASVDPRFYAAWGIKLTDTPGGANATAPTGFTVTEDSVSEGYELEFNASPVKNLRLTLNASKSKAIRNNIGGTNLRAFVNAYTAQLNTGRGGVGDLRIWWGGAGNETTLQEWYSGNQPFGSEWAQRALQEGTDVPELREWRLNAIANYDFDRGFVKGVNVGGGIRYESPIVIGYPPLLIDINAPDTPANTTYDMAHPFKGPAELNFDLWIGYSRRILKFVDWNIQLNVRNVGVGNKIVPITAEPDGTGAAYRILPPQVITLTNTFRF